MDPLVTPIAEKTGSALLNLLPDVYRDVAQPGVKQLGRALETVLGLGNTLLWPAMWLNGAAQIALEKNLERLRKRMTEVPVEKIVAPAPEVAVPILDKFAYITDPDLASMFVELLTRASTEDHQSIAHPAFVRIIESMAPDEARLLRDLESNHAPYAALWSYRQTQLARAPLPNFAMSNSSNLNLDARGNVLVYLEHLESLGLISVQKDYTLTNQQEAYNTLRDDLVASLEGVVVLENEERITFDAGAVLLTSLGSMFIAATTPAAT